MGVVSIGNPGFSEVSGFPTLDYTGLEYRQLEIYRSAAQWEPVRYAQGNVPLKSVDSEVTMDQICRRTER